MEIAICSHSTTVLCWSSEEIVLTPHPECSDGSTEDTFVCHPPVLPQLSSWRQHWQFSTAGTEDTVVLQPATKPTWGTEENIQPSLLQHYNSDSELTIGSQPLVSHFLMNLRHCEESAYSIRLVEELKCHWPSASCTALIGEKEDDFVFQPPDVLWWRHWRHLIYRPLLSSSRGSDDTLVCHPTSALWWRDWRYHLNSASYSPLIEAEYLISTWLSDGWSEIGLFLIHHPRSDGSR